MRILVFGDSITQGFHDDEFGGWANRLSALAIKRGIESDYNYDVSVVNLGVSGDTTADLLKRVDSEAKARTQKYPTDKFDVALLAIGINDSKFEMESRKNSIPIEETIKNLESITSVVSEYCQKIIIVGLTPVFDERIQPMSWKPTHGYSNEVIDSYNHKIKDFANENDFLFIDTKSVYDGNEDSCLPDGLHPNAEGHRLIFERVKESLEKESIL